MAEIDDLLVVHLRKLPKKPLDTAPQKDKKRYSELMSAAAAVAFGEALRKKGLKETLPLMSEPEKLVEAVPAQRTNGNEEEESEIGGEK